MSLDKLKESLAAKREAYLAAQHAYVMALQAEQQAAVANGGSGLPERRATDRVRRKGGWPKGKPRKLTQEIMKTPASELVAQEAKPKVGRPPKKKGRVPAKDHVWRKKGAVATKPPVPTEAELDEALEIVAGEGK